MLTMAGLLSHPIGDWGQVAGPGPRTSPAVCRFSAVSLLAFKHPHDCQFLCSLQS